MGSAHVLSKIPPSLNVQLNILANTILYVLTSFKMMALNFVDLGSLFSELTCIHY